MYNGVGLQTPRGSGTNGCVQSNKFVVNPRAIAASSKGFEPGRGTAGLTRKPDKTMLEHDRKRQIELKLLVLEEKMIDEGYSHAQIVEKLDDTRKLLEANDDGGSIALLVPQKIPETQTHEIAALKERQMETLNDAL